MRVPVPLPYCSKESAYRKRHSDTEVQAAIKASVYREVPLDKLVATQRFVNAERVKQHQSPPAPHAPPIVLVANGVPFIYNGHHRASADLASGKTSFRARVATLDGPQKFAEHAPVGTVLMMEPRAMRAGYTPRPEPCVEMVDGGIAILEIDGPLESKPGWCFDNYESIMQRFRDALESEAVNGVLLKIDSPGGMAAGLNATIDAMRKIKKRIGKPVWAYADEKCCSAAYALACVADKIYLPPAGELGSIGVTSTLVDVTAANQKAGVRRVVITSGARKADGNPDVPLTDETVAHIQRRVDRLADLYFRLVEKSRGLSVKKVKALEADTFDGKDAVSAGLADGVQSLERTLADLRAEVGADGDLDEPGKGVTENVRSQGKAKPMKMTAAKLAKLKRRVEKAEKALAAGAKTPPARESSEEDEEEKDSESAEPPSEEDEEDEEEGSESEEPSETPSEEDEEDEEEASETPSEEDEEENYEDGEEEKTASEALLAIAQNATGKKGKRAIGALAAMLAEGRSAAKVVKRIASERRSEKKALAIQNALAHRKITRHEAKDLAGKSSRFVTDFLSMRKVPLVAIDEESLKTPSPKSGGDLPEAVQTQIESAVSAVSGAKAQAKLRKKLVAAHRERLASANGAGRF